MSSFARTLSYLLSGALLALMATLILEGAFQVPLIYGWLICINIFTFLFYAIDKMNAKWSDGNPARIARKVRIPENALLLLALAGGSPAAGLAIVLLPHKINKRWFLFRYFVILAIQGIALYLLWDMLPWAEGTVAS